MKINRLLNDQDSDQNSSNPQGQGSARLDKQVAELIQTIEQSEIDEHVSRQYQKDISDAFDRSAETWKKLAPFRALDQDNNLSREELLEGLEKLLAENQFDSRINSPKRSKIVQKGVMFVFAILLIIVGFAMIIMPAPPSFELFTVFYFNINDGVTIMDLVSLLIIFGGVLMFVLNFNRK
ncbi:MAG: hypothetical protein BGO21_03255 [Dyadobacter sp. 50-39]|uniref:hypothetical protein n=1 Tax=Dyadobacter sp. 50-39 TaxID=1895756 RepID=UPI00095A24E1|nr:hypothetical protein [Dyadobacter sp. 50-39]OJV12772.1 MAG: hypothetical protein BGO21_03255 [Dyadobacter sp. 50-39]